MYTQQLHDRVATALGGIEPVLHDVMGKCVLEAELAAQGLKLPMLPPYYSTRAHMARASARRQFSESDLGGWELDEFETRNAAVHLNIDGIAMRLLHTRNGLAPAPGGNRARQSWYTASLGEQDDALFPPDVKLLLLWSADFKAGTAGLRVVRPIRPWSYGASEKIDLSIWLDPEAPFTAEHYDSRDDEEDLEMPSRHEAAEDEGGASNVAV